MSEQMQNKEADTIVPASSETSQSLSPIQHSGNKGSYFNIQAWKAMREMAGVFFRSGAIPKYIANAEQLIVVLQTGKEMGLYPMEAINNLYIVNGRVAMQGALMLARLHQFGVKLEWLEETEKIAKVKFTGLDRPDYTASFTIEEASKGGLLNKQGPWHQYPKNMLRWRALAFGTRIYCPEILQGMHTVEEMGGVELEKEKPAEPLAPKPVEGKVVEAPKEPETIAKPTTGGPSAAPEPGQKEIPIVSEPASPQEIKVFLSLLEQKEGIASDDMDSVLGYLSLAKNLEINKLEEVSRADIKKITNELLNKKTQPE